MDLSLLMPFWTQDIFTFKVCLQKKEKEEEEKEEEEEGGDEDAVRQNSQMLGKVCEPAAKEISQSNPEEVVFQTTPGEKCPLR